MVNFLYDVRLRSYRASMLPNFRILAYFGLFFLIQNREILVENRHFFIPPLHSTPPLGGFPSEYRHPVWYEKNQNGLDTRWLKITKISLVLLAQLTNVTDGQTDRRTWRQQPRYAQHRTAKITANGENQGNHGFRSFVIFQCPLSAPEIQTVWRPP